MDVLDFLGWPCYINPASQAFLRASEIKDPGLMQLLRAFCRALSRTIDEGNLSVEWESPRACSSVFTDCLVVLGFHDVWCSDVYVYASVQPHTHEVWSGLHLTCRGCRSGKQGRQFWSTEDPVPCIIPKP